jgi:hypothetical protein
MSTEKSTMPKPAVMLNRMPDLRAAVLREMKSRGMTTYALVKALKGKRPKGTDVPAPTVYEFVRGDTAINSDDLGLIMEVLGLDVTGRAKR